MGFFDFLNRRNEKRRSEMLQNGICPDCAGRGFYEYGFEFFHTVDCPQCGGTGELSPD